MIACPICGQIHQDVRPAAGHVATCIRCGSRLEGRPQQSLNRTAAFALAAILLYWPANYFPILKLDIYGARSESTVIDGAVRLYRDHNEIIALIVFLASILIPVLKLVGLVTLVVSVRLRWSRAKLWRTWLYRVIDGIGRWAMLDIFAVGVLISVVKVRGLGTVLPGVGLLPFAIVVICTLLSSASFDPQLIWNADREHAETGNDTTSESGRGQRG